MTDREFEFLTLETVDEISQSIQYRREKFGTAHPVEDLDTSIKVVLLNYGDRRRIAHCVSGDWSGPKSELNKAPNGLPICPRCGRVCTEEALGWQLGLIQEIAGEDPWGITASNPEARVAEGTKGRHEE